MAALNEIPGETASPEVSAAVRQQIRGSGLLVAGRVLSVLLVMVTQVLIVRYLATNDYGAWAYALSVVAFWQTLSNLGFQDAITRFVPIYQHHREYGKMFGTMLLSFGFVLLFGAVVIGAFFIAPDKVLALVREQEQSLKVLFILIFLVPVEAMDGLLMGLFASLASPRAIFFRRYVLAPGLRLLVVVLLIVLRTDVLFLAYGYVAASAFGIVLYGFILVRHLYRQGLLGEVRLGKIQLPVREVFSFTLPMMTSDLLVVLSDSVFVLLLGYYYGMHEVAFFRVVVPVAAMNQIVSLTASQLYMPAAARLFARGDREGLRHLYWRTAAWTAALSFPIFMATFAFAKPLTVLLFGERYAGASILLAILSIGYYVNVVFGFNGLTIKAVNKVRYVVGYNAATALFGVVINVILISRYGALGAAIGSSITVIVYAFLKQVALRLATGISVVDRTCMAFYLRIALAMLSVLAIASIAGMHLYLGIGVATGTVAAVLLFARKELKIAEVFPETMRIPLMRRFVA